MTKAKSKLRIIRIGLWVITALVALAAAYAYFSSKPESGYGPAPEQAGAQDDFAGSIGGAFNLEKPSGERFTQADLVGKPHVMFFGFTRCPDVCPTALQRMAKLRAQLDKKNAADGVGSKADDGEPFDIVFVTVDPENDTPKVVGQYVDLFGTPIIGLSGTPAEIDQIKKAYGVYGEKRPLENGDYTIDHSAGVYLIDADGKFRGMIDTKESDAVALEKLEMLTS